MNTFCEHHFFRATFFFVHQGTAGAGGGIFGGGTAFGGDPGKAFGGLDNNNSTNKDMENPFAQKNINTHSRNTYCGLMTEPNRGRETELNPDFSMFASAHNLVNGGKEY
jgi:hypothetical protein